MDRKGITRFRVEKREKIAEGGGGAGRKRGRFLHLGRKKKIDDKVIFSFRGTKENSSILTNH